MAPKSPLFMLLLVLAVTRMGFPVQGDNNVEAPVYPPMEAPIYAPFWSPEVGWAPEGSPMWSPEGSPMWSPDVPTYGPTSPLPEGFGTACVAMCVVHCKPIHPRRRCMRTCTACCKKSRCVPEFSDCCYWDTVTIRGNDVQCP